MPMDQEEVLGKRGDKAVDIEGEGEGALVDDAAEGMRVGGGAEGIPADGVEISQED